MNISSEKNVTLAGKAKVAPDLHIVQSRWHKSLHNAPVVSAKGNRFRLLVSFGMSWRDPFEIGQVLSADTSRVVAPAASKQSVKWILFTI